jgi:hypothetical protein
MGGRIGCGGSCQWTRLSPLWVVCCPTASRRRTRGSGRLSALLAPEHDVRREVCGSGFHQAVAEGIRRGSFHSIVDLQAAIDRYLA